MAEPLKNLIDRRAVQKLALRLSSSSSRRFDESAFVRRATRGLAALELKPRVVQVAHALRKALAPDYSEALAHLVETLPGAIDGTENVSQGFSEWPVLTFVELYGPDHPDLIVPSLDALEEMTQRFSAEFAIRPFLVSWPEEAFARLDAWAESDNVHVRRLASEGSRPRLPWGLQLKRQIADPSAALPLLRRLVDDPELYVRRSVANHVNDIAKDHPDIALELCEAWLRDPTPDREWVVRQALRTLIKKGDSRALALMGYGEVEVRVERFEARPDVVRVGESVTIELALASAASQPQRLLIDYAVHFLQKSGEHGRKVFKWKEVELEAGGSLEIQRKQSFREVTTRRLYPGTQRLSVMINGRDVAKTELELRPAPP